ncbi:hypothetical protein Lal_00001639 [Lupinus albus]|uniref:Putative transcription factor homeobox-WOX family n=1 Tax=Lupinus albus TaxID=3870 RepID=A0A6A4PQN2_LUPAL|nr:putative transcription factor homeobox-WOX family [Lupinus albus]KAF1893199.1 hypothetical protein Lal_00001639 [Lupinus albus]
MKLHQLARGFWEHEPPSLTLGCKRLRPLAPKLSNTNTHTPFDLKSFIKPPYDDNNDIKKDPPLSPHIQVEAHQGGTRWNPTEEQIGILEMLYRGGMRTPNAQQIEQITVKLSKYGKIEGKNVFYWFQNHKARERQKQKRNNLGLFHTPRTPTTVLSPTIHTLTLEATKDEVVGRDVIDIPYKKCRRWEFECLEEQSWPSIKEEEEEHRTTLELFPLHPEGK